MLLELTVLQRMSPLLLLVQNLALRTHCERDRFLMLFHRLSVVIVR